MEVTITPFLWLPTWSTITSSMPLHSFLVPWEGKLASLNPYLFLINYNLFLQQLLLLTSQCSSLYFWPPWNHWLNLLLQGFTTGSGDSRVIYLSFTDFWLPILLEWTVYYIPTLIEHGSQEKNVFSKGKCDQSFRTPWQPRGIGTCWSHRYCLTEDNILPKQSWSSLLLF